MGTIRSILWLFLITLICFGQKRDTISFVYAQDFPPFCWEGDEGAQGILIDFVKALLVDSLGFTITHEICPWARCQLWIEEGKRDAFFTIPTDRRREFAVVTEKPAFNSNFVLWTGKDNPKMKRIREITSLDILAENEDLINIHIIGGGWHITHLERMKRKVTKVNSTDILRLLAMNRADIYIEQEALMRYQMKESEYDTAIVMIPNVMDKTSWHIMAGKKSGSKEIIERLNKLLQTMEESGELDRLREKIFARYK